MYTTDYMDNGCTDFDVRLTYREQNSAIGNLEICFNDEWQQVLSSTLDSADIDVACRSLGFTAFDNFPELNPRILLQFFPTTSESFFTLSFNCSGEEKTLRECHAEQTFVKRIVDESITLRVQCLSK